MNIRIATTADTEAAATLALLLWPHHTLAEMCANMAGQIASEGADILLAEVDGQAVAFAECALRHDYVEGTSGGPVGYLEGIYVREGYRRQGVARAMVDACARWAAGKGCREFASDCLLENTQSIAFHLGAGFREAGRIVCFVKEIQP